MKIVTQDMITDLLRRAAVMPRRRINLNLHETPGDPVNRFVNAGCVGSYARPHRHHPSKWELTSLLYGELDIIAFAPDGAVIDRWTLAAGRTPVVEIPGGCWHTVMFRAPAAVVLEVTRGPYEPQLNKEFAVWAPAEGDPDVGSFLDWLGAANIGERWHARHG